MDNLQDPAVRSGIKVAVSGHGGFLGQHLVPTISSNGFDVVLIDGDVRDAHAWERPFDVLVHLAAATQGRFRRDAKDAFSINVDGTHRALEACDRWGARIIYPSSCGVCRPDSTGRVSETSDVDPTSPYTCSKAIGESLCRVYSEHFGVGSSILRLFNVYGPNQGVEFLIPYIVKQVLSGDQAIIRHPYSTRDFVHVADVIRAFEGALWRALPFEVLNVGSGSQVSILRVLETVAEIAGVSPDWTAGGSSEPDPIPSVWADNAQIRKDLGWSPKVDFECGLRDIVQSSLGR